MKVIIALLLFLFGSAWHYTDVGCNEVHLTGDGPAVHVLIQDNGGAVLFQGAFPAHHFTHGAAIVLPNVNTGFFVITVYHMEGHRPRFFMNHVWEQCGLVR